MKLRRRRQDPFSHHADEDSRLAAASDRLEAEQADLEAKRERLARDRALSKHLGEGDLDRIVEQEGDVQERLHEVGVSLGEIVEARHEIARRAIASARESLQTLIKDREQQELKAQAARGEAASAYQAATERHERRTAATAELRASLEEVEGDARAVEAALAEGRADPLVAVREHRDRLRTKHHNEIVAAHRENRLPEKLTPIEAAWVREMEESAARLHAKRVQISRAAGTLPVTVAEAEARATGGKQVESPHHLPAHTPFPRLRR